MRRFPVLIAIVVAVLTGGVLVLTGGPREIARAARDARALALLPQRPLADMLLLPDGAESDLVVFRDGEAGWFELDMAALPASLEIGFSGPGFVDLLVGAEPVPRYCEGAERAGKILWIVAAGEIARDFAFCDPRRMDLGPLRPFAGPVEMIVEELAAEDVAARAAGIAGDADRAIVSWPQRLSPYSHRRVITGPYTWYPPGSGSARADLLDRLEDAVLAAVGRGRVEMRQSGQAPPVFTLFEDQVPIASGLAVSLDGQIAVLDGFMADATEIRVDCAPADCAALDDLDLAPLFEAARDRSLLEEGLAVAILDPDPGRRGGLLPQIPTPDDLGDGSVTLGPVGPITYATRHIRRIEDE